MYPESDLIPLSALQHFAFCQRQCAFIHLERIWLENRLTAEGRIMHEHVHQEAHETRKGVRAEFSVALRSLRLGIFGQADVVEFHKDRIRPVEYKRGKPKSDNCDAIQLCAQALCLEEMLDRGISEGMLFYGKTRRRKTISFDAALREETESAARGLHELVCSGKTPEPVYAPRCKSCSFFEVCLPKVLGRRRSVKRYLEKASE